LRDLLRRAGLDGETLASRQPGYLLDVEAEGLDAARFEVLCARAGTEPAPIAAGTWERALGLWRGEAYAEVDDLSVRSAAVRLEEARLIATEAYGGALVAAGRSAEAVPLLEAFVATHPLREDARGHLMRALYATGRHADALAHYDRYRRALAEELGLEPSAALAQLHQRVLAHDLSSPGPGEQRRATRRAGPGGLAGLVPRYVSVGGARLAWAETGSGVPVVALPGWLSDLDVIGSGRDPRSSVLERVARRHRLVLYDRVGTGRSRDSAPDASLDHAVAELAAVIDAAGPPVVLLAMSQAGPVALRYAAAFPDRVSALVLHGTYASGPASFRDPVVRQTLVGLVRAHWGLGSDLLAALYRPGAGPHAAAHLARVLRESAPADVAADYLDAVFDADATAVLPLVQAPTLVMHYRGDRVMPFQAGAALAEALPRARLLALDGDYHLPDATDLDRVADEVDALIREGATTASTL
jgi:pimeloyl-ACP methyl ester carboxylesterase/DNA-binding SARP family transcriptional activator